jgi:hypothetical protein
MSSATAPTIPNVKKPNSNSNATTVVNMSGNLVSLLGNLLTDESNSGYKAQLTDLQSDKTDAGRDRISSIYNAVIKGTTDNEKRTILIAELNKYKTAGGRRRKSRRSKKAKKATKRKHRRHH